MAYEFDAQAQVFIRLNAGIALQAALCPTLVGGQAEARRSHGLKSRQTGWSVGPESVNGPETSSTNHEGLTPW